MQRIAHGSTEPESIESSENIIHGLTDAAPHLIFPTLDASPERAPFQYLYPDLSEGDDYLILQSPDTLNNLSRLGEKMHDKIEMGADNSDIPSIYTYFGQFVDHDITFTNIDKDKGLTDSLLLDSKSLTPWTKKEIFAKVWNKRTSLLALDCVYGAMKGGVLPPRTADNKLALSTVVKTNDPVKYKDEWNDVPRGPKSKNGKEDRAALIADPRNDSHVIISQMHVAFLRAHNTIIDKKKCSFEEARRILQMHYQWIVINDFLPTIVGQNEINKAMNERLPFDPAKGLPFEFAVGAYRFGHSMVRHLYYYNKNYSRLSLIRLFTLTMLSGNGQPTPNEGYETLPDKAIIEWKAFFDSKVNPARKLRPKMAEPLFTVLDESNIRVPGEFRLSVLDLKRGYMMRIPTGQAIAKRLGITPLTPTEIENVFLEQVDRDFLRTTTLSQRTPLFFYVLAEAALAKTQKLGPVGGRLVAGVLIDVVRSHNYSFLNNPDWKPFLRGDDEFYLRDLLRLGGVLEPYLMD